MNMKLTKAFYIIVFLFSSQVYSSQAYSFELFSDSEITQHWQQSSSNSTREIDHVPWNNLLQSYIQTEEGLNYFNYGEVSDADRKLLQVYLSDLQSVVVTELNSKEQFAYWVNLYNALTVETILDHYPLESILDISFSLLSRGPWKEELVEVEGFELSLDDIEHEILRPIYGDNRIHYAVNCASIGCPNLQGEAFTSSNLEALLDKSAKEYINHPRGVSVVDGEVQASSIFDWYADDFGDNDKEIIQHFLIYAEPDLAQGLAQLTQIDDYQYDWSLNE